MPLPSPVNAVALLWIHRRFVWSLTLTGVSSRYRTSWFGLFWPVIHPVLLIGVFTFVFAYVMPLRWVAEESGGVGFPLFLYSGFLVFTFFADVVARAPTLVLENTNLVKKVVFPLEVLAMVSACTSLLFFAVNLGVFSVFLALLGPGLPWFAPVLLGLFIPFALFLIGVAWFLSALTVYVRDVTHVIGIFVTAMMFFSPVFYPLSSAPEPVQAALSLSPLTIVIEGIRAVAFDHVLPDGGDMLILWVGSLAVFYLGYLWFQRVKEGFADVL